MLSNTDEFVIDVRGTIVNICLFLISQRTTTMTSSVQLVSESAGAYDANTC